MDATGWAHNNLPPDVEIRAGWDACMASVKRSAAQETIQALLEQGLQGPVDLQKSTRILRWDNQAANGANSIATQIVSSGRASGRGGTYWSLARKSTIAATNSGVAGAVR